MLTSLISTNLMGLLELTGLTGLVLVLVLVMLEGQVLMGKLQLMTSIKSLKPVSIKIIKHISFS